MKTAIFLMMMMMMMPTTKKKPQTTHIFASGVNHEKIYFSKRFRLDVLISDHVRTCTSHASPHVPSLGKFTQQISTRPTCPVILHVNETVSHTTHKIKQINLKVR